MWDAELCGFASLLQGFQAFTQESLMADAGDETGLLLLAAETVVSNRLSQSEKFL